MIAYVCKYTPVEVLEALGEETVRIAPAETDYNLAEALMHANMCSYAKGVLEVMESGIYDGLVLTDCCDSIRRLYDILKKRYPDKFIYMLDVPRKVNDFSAHIYTERIEKMVRAYEEYKGIKADPGQLAAETAYKAVQTAAFTRKEEEEKEKSEDPHLSQVGIMGARCPDAIKNMLTDRGVQIAFDLTCTGAGRLSGAYDLLQADIDQVDSDRYAASLLNQIPCLRMADAVGRERFLEGFTGRLDGIVYHTVKFCDMYSYEYAEILNEDYRKKLLGSPIPVLKLDTDLTVQDKNDAQRPLTNEGQLSTRIQAFTETLRQGRTDESRRDLERRMNFAKKREGKQMIVLGIDSGSTSTNAVLMDQNKKILAYKVIRTGAKSSLSGQKARELILADAGLSQEDILYTVATGYGRSAVDFADQQVTEISCHAKGARYFDPKVRTILDIGGQDSKAIRLRENGQVEDFVMNDKCAAGTGRFLEAMAQTLEVGIDQLGPIALKSKEDITISSMCTVFAESEVISLIAENKEKADIAAALCRSVASKSYSLMRRVGLEPDFMMTGGVARNKGVVKAVEEKIGAPLFIPEEPDIVGAVGACLFGLEKMLSSETDK